MGIIYLVRHGESEVNAGEYRLCGALDVPLTEEGRRQAEQLAERLAKERVTKVFSSDLQRARQTAEIIAQRHGLLVELVSELREIDYGQWEGKSVREIQARWPDLLAQRDTEPEAFQAPGGERFSNFTERVLAAIEAVAQRHGHEAVVVVAHGTVNRVLLCLLLGLPLRCYRQIGQDNGCLNVLETHGKRITVLCVNDTCHLTLEGWKAGRLEG